MMAQHDHTTNTPNRMPDPPLDLQSSGIATALSIDFWKPTPASKCEYEPDPSLAVNFVCMNPNTPTPEPPDLVETARYQEIFVDLVGMLCAVTDAGCRHLLDDRFDSFLEQGEKDFKKSLLEFLSKQTDQAKSTHAFEYLEHILESKMGYKSDPYHGKRKVKDRIRGCRRTRSLRNPSPPPSPTRQKTSNPGHVFVCLSSVCDIMCDAFLCPGSICRTSDIIKGRVFGQWRKKMVEQKHKRVVDGKIWPLECHEGYDRVVTLQNWTNESEIPLFVAGEVSLEASIKFANVQSDLPSESQHIDALMETLDQFLNLSSKLVRQRSPHVGRQRYLLAVPVIGTKGGFAADLTGQIVEQLLVRLNNFTLRNSDMDVVLVCADEATYAHAQVVRQRYYASDQTNEVFPCFHRLSDKQKQYAGQLAALASERHLALFIGAGVSVGSGLPGWFDLLQIIEDNFTPTGHLSERKLGETTDWNPLKMATELEKLCRQRSDRSGVTLSLENRVCRCLQGKGEYPGLLLSLLISLPCHSIVTQNYDRLIEKACKLWNVAGPPDDGTSKRNLSIIPYAPKRTARYWLLKMHGCVSNPGDLVLTEEDYSGSSTSIDRMQALSGLVQASLLTKHLLFVGFSLSDPNYLRIVDQVREALRPYCATPQKPVRVSEQKSISTKEQ